MFNATQFVIDKVRRITQINLATGLVDFTGTSVESPQIEFTGESTDKTDAQGVLLARFDTAKGVNFSGELSLLNLNLMGAQLGSEVQVADSSKKVKGADFAILTVTDDKGTKTATLKHVPTSAPAAVYTMSEDKNISGMIDVGVDEGNAKIEGKVITLPASFVGTTVGVFYEYETDSAVKLVDSAESPEDIYKNRAEAARIRAEERLQHKQSMHEYYQSKIALSGAMQRLQTSAKYRR